MSQCLRCTAPNPTVHITLNAGGSFVTLDLCDGCAPLAHEIDIKTPRRHMAGCPRCGSTATEIELRGRFGCSDDYSIFADRVAKALEAYHGSSKHVGKIPKIKQEDFF